MGGSGHSTASVPFPALKNVPSIHYSPSPSLLYSPRPVICTCSEPLFLPRPPRPCSLWVSVPISLPGHCPFSGALSLSGYLSSLPGVSVLLFHLGISSSLFLLPLKVFHSSSFFFSLPDSFMSYFLPLALRLTSFQLSLVSKFPHSLLWAQWGDPGLRCELHLPLKSRLPKGRCEVSERA